MTRLQALGRRAFWRDRYEMCRAYALCEYGEDAWPFVDVERRLSDLRALGKRRHVACVLVQTREMALNRRMSMRYTAIPMMVYERGKDIRIDA